MYYVFIENGKISGVGQCPIRNEEIQNIEISEELFSEISEIPNKYIWDGANVVLNPNYEEEEKAKEKARILELKMTRSDFFDGTIMAWGVNEKLLLPLIENMLLALPLDEKLKLKAINNFENAQNFYRKHDLFKIIVNIPLQLTDTIQVIITEEHLDKFFDEVDKGNKETAWQYLPQPTLIEVAEDDI